MGPDWLAGEWDAGQRLILPQPGGRLTRVARCAVAGCPSDAHGARSLCVRHRVQFADSDTPEVESWLASDQPAVFDRRRCTDAPCTVTGPDGAACPRPARGRWRLCNAHDLSWAKRRAKGVAWETFLAGATPRPDLGRCVAACCYLAASHPDRRLCQTHLRLWREDGHPDDTAFAVWAAGVRQPVNSRVLSLRGLPELVVAELAYGIGCRAADQVSVVTGGMRPWIDQLRTLGLASVVDFDPTLLEGIGDRAHVRFARFTVDRVGLAYADPDAEHRNDVWDLRLFGCPGRRHLDFTAIRQAWLREAAKRWAAATIGRVGDSALSHRVGSVGVFSAVLASGPGGGHDPAMLSRADIERFLARVATGGVSTSGRPLGPKAKAAVIEESALMLREAHELGFLPASLSPMFAFRRGDRTPRVPQPPPARALPTTVVAQLDQQLGVLTDVPGATSGARIPSLGVLGEHAGQMAVLTYQLLKSTGRRVGEISTLHLDCLDVDEHGKDVLVYDNHKAARMGRRLPLADSTLTAAIRAQQAWVTARFPTTPRPELWLLPRPHKNLDGTNHLTPSLINAWMRGWMARIPQLLAGPPGADQTVPFDHNRIVPHVFRHTYAQTMADTGVAPSVLRELMDHRSLSTTLGYYQVGEQRKRAAMELLARHTIDNLGAARTVTGQPSTAGGLREHLSWVAVPMGKCSEPTNVRTGGQACPIRYQCAGCAHFESDPSYLPELHAYTDDLRNQREAMIAADAADWAVDHLTRQINIITAHIAAHDTLLHDLPQAERADITEATAAVRKARQHLPLVFGTRPSSHGR